MDEPDALSRRGLAKGAAWATPVIALGALAPAYAASPVPCPQLPTPSSWTTTVSGTLGPDSSGGYGWNATAPYRFDVYRDNGSTTAPLTITTSTTLAVRSGVTYTLNTPIYWGYGNGVAAQSTAQSVSLTFGPQNVFTATTRSGQLSTPGNTAIASSYTAGTTGNITVTLTFTVTARGSRAANDDIILTMPSFTRCAQG